MNGRIRFFQTIVFVVGVMCSPYIWADITLETQSEEYIFDAPVNQKNPDTNFSSRSYMEIGATWAANDSWRVFLAFNIRQFLIDQKYDPSKVILKSISLELTQYPASFINWFSEVHVSFPTSSWQESTITWNNQPQYDPDFFTYNPHTEVGQVDIIESTLMTKYFQKYLDGILNWENGIVLMHPTAPFEVDLNERIAYYTSENTPNIRPKFVIRFTLYQPTPSSNFISLNGIDLISNQLLADPPAGFQMGKIAFGSIPAGNGTDGTGMEINLAPGQGVWILSEKIIDAPSLMNISGYVRSSNKAPAIALVALNSPIDGQLAYTNLTGDEIPIGDYRSMNLFYRPPGGKLQLAIQAVNYPFSTLSSTVWVDSLDVNPLVPVVEGTPVDLEVDGSFEKGVDKLILNMNGTDGFITPFFETLSDIAIRLTVQPQNLAANIGTLVQGVYDQFPFRLLGQVSVMRDSIPGGGTLAFVMTNGYQNVGVFRYVDELPGPGSPQAEYLILGSDFTVNNPDIPIHVVLQNGGPGADSSVVVDDLMLLKSSVESTIKPIGIDIPDWTPDPTPTPTPTPVPQLETITIPLYNLPDGAKPLEMVLIPAGTFTMGCPADERGSYVWEWLSHQVTLTKDFYLGRYEVTQAQYQAIMNNNPSYFSGKPNNPVEQVTWYDCAIFCNRLSEREGLTPVYNESTWATNWNANGYRLPTEAEWEYACRAGTTWRFSHGDVLECDDKCGSCATHDQYMWWCGNSGNQTHEVGLKLPNPSGLYDMHGNVWEWCNDWWEAPSNRGPQVDPTGVNSGSYRVRRGGCWFNGAWNCRSASRDGYYPVYGFNNRGFRIVLSRTS